MEHFTRARARQRLEFKAPALMEFSGFQFVWIERENEGRDMAKDEETGHCGVFTMVQVPQQVYYYIIPLGSPVIL